ncbi:glucoamylase [Cryptococcus deuterogattii R265]|uniref:Glucoamylase n=1 Tax=Cryptococcus deuterogattii (strain R265) TaxID=294750 RepID=A0A095CEK5_CRYD2|nr:glucoamylase [Cryptococcus deuterogattii R265]KIR73737.1 glucoamylase [Cryptococcus deuterogattii CA1014]
MASRPDMECDLLSCKKGLLPRSVTLQPPASMTEHNDHRYRRVVTKGLFLCLLILSAIVTKVSLGLWAHCLNSQWIHFDHQSDHQSLLLESRILANIGPGIGAKEGLVVASPSRGHGKEPDYYYTWTRDSALTISTLISHLRSDLADIDNATASWEMYSALSDTLKEYLFRDYIESQAEIQIGKNPSGDLKSGGLNEPKFHVNGTPFIGNWGRPQRDGPALRAMTVMIYANFLLDRGFPSDVSYVKQWIYDPRQLKAPGKVLKNDLEEVAHGWSRGGFDLWEEVDGHHLFTLLVSRKALYHGSIFARRLKDVGAADSYLAQAHAITQKLPLFWDSKRGYWLSSLRGRDLELVQIESEFDTTNIYPRREWLDCALPLSIIHAGSHTLQPSHNFSFPFSAIDPNVLSTMHLYIKSFDGLYGINDGKSWLEGWALGRYREDVYDGKGHSQGNPWFICTFSLAHSLYLAYKEFREVGAIVIANQTLSFWEDVVSISPTPPKVGAGDVWIEGRDRRFTEGMKCLKEVAGRFMEVGVQVAMENGGRMSEQIGR